MPDVNALTQNIVQILDLTRDMDQYDQRIAFMVLLDLNTLILHKAYGVTEAELKEKDAEARVVMQEMMHMFEEYCDKLVRADC
ncbi:MAG: hypothetical protein JRN52_07380 [Nitrososphaerota archaeon]|nr:hypothetical protein [Nitrososphaerota archaeon]